MPIEVKDAKYYKLYEVAELLGMHIVTLRRMIKRKKLKARKLGREYIVTEDAVKDFLDGK